MRKEIKRKHLHNITIEGCSFSTELQYNTNTDYIGIYTYHRYRNLNKMKEYKKQYYKDNKEKIKERTKQYNKNNKEQRKQYYEDNRNLNITIKGSIEYRKKISCILQGIDIKDFNGFTHKQKYCSKFNEFLKTKIRNKYNNCDYISGIHKDICSPNQELSVHHVNYDKQCGCDGSRCELIPLSRRNHIKTNYNRSFWNRLFIYSLEYDKEYYK